MLQLVMFSPEEHITEGRFVLLGLTEQGIECSHLLPYLFCLGQKLPADHFKVAGRTLQTLPGWNYIIKPQL